MPWQAKITNARQEDTRARVFYEISPTGETAGQVYAREYTVDLAGKSRADARREVLDAIRQQVDALNDADRRIANLLADIIGQVIS
jgi:hypothetical protein